MLETSCENDHHHLATSNNKGWFRLKESQSLPEQMINTPCQYPFTMVYQVPEISEDFPYVLSTVFECLMVDGCLVNSPTKRNLEMHSSPTRAGLSVAHHHNHQRTIPEECLDAMVIPMVKSITVIPLIKTSKFASVMWDVQLLPHLCFSCDLQVLVTLLPKVFTFGFSLPSICGLVFQPRSP